METKYILLYGGNTTNEGTVLGLDTQRRCNKLIDIATKNPDTTFIVFLAAGIRPDKKQYPQLKYVMQNYLQSKGLENITVIICIVDGWTTFYESIAAFDTMQRHPIETLYVLSSWYHLPRIVVIWKLLRKNFRIKTISAPSPLSILSLLVEVGGMYRLVKKYRTYKKSLSTL